LFKGLITSSIARPLKTRNVREQVEAAILFDLVCDNSSGRNTGSTLVYLFFLRGIQKNTSDPDGLRHTRNRRLLHFSRLEQANFLEKTSTCMSVLSTIAFPADGNSTDDNLRMCSCSSAVKLKGIQTELIEEISRWTSSIGTCLNALEAPNLDISIQHRTPDKRKRSRPLVTESPSRSSPNSKSPLPSSRDASLKFASQYCAVRFAALFDIPERQRSPRQFGQFIAKFPGPATVVPKCGSRVADFRTATQVGQYETSVGRFVAPHLAPGPAHPPPPLGAGRSSGSSDLRVRRSEVVRVRRKCGCVEKMDSQTVISIIQNSIPLLHGLPIYPGWKTPYFSHLGFDIFRGFLPRIGPRKLAIAKK
ncbi:unnamed protein product, partial [Nesidiocoris tenuis]